MLVDSRFVDASVMSAHPFIYLKAALTENDLDLVQDANISTVSNSTIVRSTLSFQAKFLPFGRPHSVRLVVIRPDIQKTWHVCSSPLFLKNLGAGPGHLKSTER